MKKAILAFITIIFISILCSCGKPDSKAVLKENRKDDNISYDGKTIDELLNAPLPEEFSEDSTLTSKENVEYGKTYTSNSGAFITKQVVAYKGKDLYGKEVSKAKALKIATSGKFAKDKDRTRWLMLDHDIDELPFQSFHSQYIAVTKRKDYLICITIRGAGEELSKEETNMFIEIVKGTSAIPAK